MESVNIKNTQPVWYKSLFRFSFGKHREKEVIWISFPYSNANVLMLKSHTKPLWSQSQKSWYVFDSNKYRTQFGLTPKLVGKEMILQIHPINQKAFQDFQNQILLKGFSQSTMRVYSVEFAQLLYVLKDYPVEKLTKEKLKSYFLYCIKELGLSENYLHSRINAIKFYFEKVLHQDKMFFDIPRPKKPQLLPKSLNTKEIEKIIQITENPKHKLIIQLSYGMGLRVSEIINLKISDIDSQSMRVLIERGKGKKDRFVNLPEVILQDLRAYYKTFQPKIYLFEGKEGGQYSIRSAQSVFKTAMKKANINKTVGIHSLRHSYATHLLEYGTDISLIQKLLGHSDIKTTLNYTRVADRTIQSVKSPLDRMKP